MKSEVFERWRRHRTTSHERAHWLQRFDRSHLSGREFARRHGLGLSTLNRWFSQRAAGSASTPPLLREVSLGQMFGQPPWIAEVQRPDGLTIRLSAAALPLVEQLLLSQPC